MLESDGWFCEQDSDWKRRKMIDHMQNKRNRISNARKYFFQNNWESTIQCEFARRIGNTGDGGKWICNIHRYQEMIDTIILIYSFGSHGDFSFERAIKNELPNAEIHTFDRDIFQCPENVCIFHQATLGSRKINGSKSLRAVINELGHQKREIHILKVDIEGSEYDLFEEFFNSQTKNQTGGLYIRQILFEIHLGRGQNEEPSQRTHRLFELFRANNFVIFHKESNLYDPQNAFEFAILRLNPAFFSPIR
ncbi:unnamed protein product [Adineta steineri]|uniref:Methyltransferase domain-containing protein n=1 Tax=Adineta steineri TaxID=433720 RepID=A0A816E989_9BILA|nr:unnamed protein product [Adineta steineri]CAF1644652.1 unnamed protein product [Adineta steineri]